MPNQPRASAPSQSRRARLHHLALGARDIERVAAFYRDLLGLPEVERQRGPDGRTRSIWLALGEGVLMIESTAVSPRRVRGDGGPFLLALAAGAARRNELEVALAASGFPVESRTEHTIYLRDPEGNRIAVSSYPLPGTKATKK